jgi:protein-S-isoprenylcysteine O-methyltransferase Ste14
MTDPLNPNNFVARGGTWVVVQSVLLTAVIVLGVIFPGDWTRLPVIVTGTVLFATGACFGIAGMLVLGRNRTPYPQPRAGSELVQRGIYARMRHPLYTSVMLASLGWACIWQSAASFGAAVALIPFFHAKARREERWLRKKFPGYSDYAQRVPRFIPRLGRGKSNL